MEITKILKNLDIEFNNITKIEEESFGSDVYSVSTSSKSFILKLPYNKAKFFRESYIYKKHNSISFIPKLFNELAPRGDFNGALLIENINGIGLKFGQIDNVIAQKMGALLAQFHNLEISGLGNFTEKGFEKLKFSSWWEYRSDLLLNIWGKNIEPHIENNLYSKSIEYLSSFYKTLIRSKDGNTLIHCDFRPANILKTPYGKLMLIDFESTRTGDACYDFIKIYESIGKDKQLWNSFTSSYAKDQTLPDLKTLLPYYEFELNFGFLNWAIEHKDQKLFEERLVNVKSILSTLQG